VGYLPYICTINNQLKNNIMSKVILIIGSISFLTKDDDEISEYTDKSRLVLVHSINTTVECSDEEAGMLGEEALAVGYDSYLIPESYVGGDIIFECENNNSPISIEEFRREFID
jgi:hypothetical protein